MDDVILNKIAIIEHCLTRIAEEYYGHENELTVNYTKQDSVILNLQRACEAAIDLGMRAVRMKNLGIPQNSRDVFDFLETAKVISPSLSKSLQAMVGFRNIAVHDYQKINLEVVRAIITTHLRDLEQFIQQMRSFG